MNKVSKTAKGQKKILFVICSLLLSIALTSCNDKWEEHYDRPEVSSGTLWEMISSVGELSNFARVAEACGYDKVLNGSQTFTVFAPDFDTTIPLRALRAPRAVVSVLIRS